MLWPTHLISATHQGASAPYVSGRQVYLHTRHPNMDLVVRPQGQPLHTFMQDNGPSRPAYTRGDTVTVTSCINGAPLPPVTQFAIGDVDSRGHLFGPYVECQLTVLGE